MRAVFIRHGDAPSGRQMKPAILGVPQVFY